MAMSRALAQAVDIGDDEPVTLAEACRVFFGGRISPSALRTEAAKGRLVITQIARKDFVTRRAIVDPLAVLMASWNGDSSRSIFAALAVSVLSAIVVAPLSTSMSRGMPLIVAWTWKWPSSLIGIRNSLPTTC